MLSNQRPFNHSVKVTSRRHSDGLPKSMVVERKEQEQSNATLQSLWAVLRNMYPVVWCRTKTGYRVRRVITQFENCVLLKKLNDDGCMLLKTSAIEENVPDVSEAEVRCFIESIPKLLVSNLQVKASITSQERVLGWNGYRWETSKREIVVKRFERAPYSHPESSFIKSVGVAEARTSRAYTVQVNELKAVQAESAVSNADELTRTQRALDLSENLNRKLQERESNLVKELKQSERSRQQLERSVEEHRTRMATQRSTVEDLERDISQKTKTITKLNTQIDHLKDSATDARDKIEGCKRRIKHNESENRNLRQQIDELHVEVEQQSRTIGNFEKKTSADKVEIQRLRQDLDEAYRQNAHHRDNERIFQQQAEELRMVREKNQGLVEERSILQAKLAEGRTHSLISEYTGYDFGKEMAELRDQKIEDAVEVLTSLDLDEEDAGKLMFKIFMFAYQFCQDRLVDVLTMLNVVGNEQLERVFIIKLQDEYMQTFDNAALEVAFLEAFSEELGDAASSRPVLEYVRKSGEICWCVVIRLEPKLHFMPKEQVESEIMFNSSQFKDITSKIRKGDVAQVIAYVLPGLYRVDANSPVSPDALPCVYPKKIRKVQKVVEKPNVACLSTQSRPAAAPSREELLHGAEEDIWDGNVEAAKEKLTGLGWHTWNIEICCGAEGCGAVLFKRWLEYERQTANGNAFECPNDEDHMYVRVQRKFW